MDCRGTFYPFVPPRLSAVLPLLPWIAASYRQHLAFHNAFVQIELQEACRSLSFRRNGFNDSATDGEVLVPTIASRVKETNQLTGASVQGTDVAPLPHVAPQASISQIGGNGRPSVFAADDVINLMRRIGIVFVQQAVLASVAGTLGDQLPQLVRNVTWQGACAGVPVP